MTTFLTRLLGRLPIGWLQLTHSKPRLVAAVAGVAFANILVFVQLGILGALNDSIRTTYAMFDADILISAGDANTLNEGANVPRQRMFDALAVPGVASAGPLYMANTSWDETGQRISFLVLAVPPEDPQFLVDPFEAQVAGLHLLDTVVVDELARGLAADTFGTPSNETPFGLELGSRAVDAVGTLRIGGGFSSDGTMLASDQTFLRLFPNRRAGAPDHVLVNAEPGASVHEVVSRLRRSLPMEHLKVRTLSEAATADQRYQTTQRPTGLIFGFGVVMGVIVGLIIVYQILSTDVADHIREYATFKAIGYDQAFLLGVIFEEAAALAAMGFVPGFVVSWGSYSVLAAATGLPMHMSLPRALLVFAGTVVACAVSGGLAARKLAKSDPADLF